VDITGVVGAIVTVGMLVDVFTTVEVFSTDTVNTGDTVFGMQADITRIPIRQMRLIRRIDSSLI
jgi:hypothetical protein